MLNAILSPILSSVLDPVLNAVGAPLIRRELIAVLRTRKAFWLLLIAVALSTFFPLLAWPSAGGPDVTFSSYRVRMVFATFVFTQLAVVLLCVPAFTAGAFAGERERGTYDLLHTTLLPPLSIVAAKLIASIGYSLLLLLAAAPVMAVLTLLGGIDMEMVLAVYLVTIAAVAMTGLVCLTVSLRARRTVHAAVRGTAWGLFWNLGLLLLLSLGIALFSLWAGAGGRGGPAPGLMFLWAFSSVTPMISIVVGGPPGVSPSFVLSVYLAYAGVLSLLHLAYLLVKVRRPPGSLGAPGGRRRRLARGGGAAGRPRRRRDVRASLLWRWIFTPAGERAPVTRNPILRKEILTDFAGRLPFRRAAFWGPLGVFSLISLIGDSAVEVVGPPLMVGLTLLLVLLPATAAGSIPRELEQGNIDLLRGTLLPMRAIVDGKIIASLWAWLGLIAAAVLFAGVRPLFAESRSVGFFGSRSVDVAAFARDMMLVTANVFAVSTLFAVTVSTLMGVLFRRALTAMVAAYAAIAGVLIVLPMVAALAESSFLRGTDESTVCGLHPYATLGLSVFDYHNSDVGTTNAIFLSLYGGVSAVVWALARGLFERRGARDP